MSWPMAVFGSVVVFGLYAAIDTWLKEPYLHKKVGDCVLTARGDKAVDYVIDCHEQDAEKRRAVRSGER